MAAKAAWGQRPTGLESIVSLRTCTLPEPPCVSRSRISPGARGCSPTAAFSSSFWPSWRGTGRGKRTRSLPPLLRPGCSSAAQLPFTRGGKPPPPSSCAGSSVHSLACLHPAPLLDGERVGNRAHTPRIPAEGALPACCAGLVRKDGGPQACDFCKRNERVGGNSETEISKLRGRAGLSPQACQILHWDGLHCSTNHPELSRQCGQCPRQKGLSCAIFPPCAPLPAAGCMQEEGAIGQVGHLASARLLTFQGTGGEAPR